MSVAYGIYPGALAGTETAGVEIFEQVGGVGRGWANDGGSIGPLSRWGETDGPEAVGGSGAGEESLLVADDGDISGCESHMTVMVAKLAHQEQCVVGEGWEEMRFASSLW